MGWLKNATTGFVDNFRSKKELEKLFARAVWAMGGNCPADIIQEHPISRLSHVLGRALHTISE
jgi:hypothetical protein